MADDQGPEPTGWELMRGLNEVKDAIRELGSRVVSIDVYNADKQGNTERHQRAEARIGELETKATESDKLRRQNRLTVSLAVVSPLLSAGLAYLVGVITK